MVRRAVFPGRHHHILYVYSADQLTTQPEEVIMAKWLRRIRIVLKLLFLCVGVSCGILYRKEVEVEVTLLWMRYTKLGIFTNR